MVLKQITKTVEMVNRKGLLYPGRFSESFNRGDCTMTRDNELAGQEH